MLVSEIMKMPPATCSTNDMVNAAAKIMREHKCGFVPVLDGRGAVVGVVTDRDVCLVLAPRRRDAPTSDDIVEALKGICSPGAIESSPA